jgi:hypothetical protein
MRNVIWLSDGEQRGIAEIAVHFQQQPQAGIAAKSTGELGMSIISSGISDRRGRDMGRMAKETRAPNGIPPGVRAVIPQKTGGQVFNLGLLIEQIPAPGAVPHVERGGVPAAVHAAAPGTLHDDPAALPFDFALDDGAGLFAFGQFFGLFFRLPSNLDFDFVRHHHPPRPTGRAGIRRPRPTFQARMVEQALGLSNPSRTGFRTRRRSTRRGWGCPSNGSCRRTRGTA